jgi:hypothetical protein
MPPDLTRVLFTPEYHVIMDVGGAKSAVVLGQLRHRIMENGCEVLMVVNTRRPFAGSAADIVASMRNIEAVSGLAVTGLVSNTNLGGDTTEQHVAEGLRAVQEVSALTGLPLRWLVLPAWLYDRLEHDVPVLPLQPMTHYPWME